MKFVFTVSVIAFMAQLSPPLEALYQPTSDLSGRWNQSGDLFDKLPPDLLDDSISRFQRSPNGDALKTSLDHIKMIARITNGIYLQSGLSSGTIPADKLISELLRFGSVTTAQIAGIDSSKIITAIDTLKNLPKSLTASKQVENVEKTLSLFKTILEEIDGIGDVKLRPRAKDFKKLLEDLEKDGVKMAPIKEISDTKAWWTLELTQSTKAIHLGFEKSNFGYVKLALTEIKASGAKLKAMPSLWTSKVFQSAVDGIREDTQLLKVIPSLQQALSLLSRQTAEWEAYSTFIGNFMQTIESLKPAQSDIQAVKTVVEGYHVKRQDRLLNFTTGFPNGPSDIGQMSVDVVDPWMKDVVKSDQLAVALNGLKNLEVLSKKIEDVLKAPHLELDISSLYENFDSIDRLASEGTNINSEIKEASTCKLLTYVDVTANYVTGLQTILIGIDTKIKTIEKLVGPLIDAVTAPGLAELCDEFIEICAKSSTAADVDKFRKHANFKKLKAAVDKVYDVIVQIGDVEKPKTIREDAANAITELSNLTKFHGELDHFAEFLNCLQQKDGVKHLIAAHVRIAEIRSFDQKTFSSLDNGLEVMKKVAGTSEDLKKLKKSIDAMKGVTNPEIEGLKELPDPQKHSKTIGSAVQGISNMKNALEKKSDLDTLIGYLDVVKKYKNKMTSEDLDALLNLIPTIQAMYKSLDSFETSVTAPTTTTLVDQTGIFEKAKTVTGISADLQKIGDSVKALKELVDDVEDKKTLENLETSIQMMDSMGLEFASYQTSFTGAKTSLTALDDFFAQFASSVLKETSTEEAKKMNMLIFMIAGALVLALVPLLLFNFLCYKFNFYFYSSMFPFLFPQPNFWKPAPHLLKLAVNRLTTSVDNRYEVNNDEIDFLEDDVSKNDVGLRFKKYFVESFIADRNRSIEELDPNDLGLVDLPKRRLGDSVKTAKDKSNKAAGKTSEAKPKSDAENSEAKTSEVKPSETKSRAGGGADKTPDDKKEKTSETKSKTSEVKEKASVKASEKAPTKTLPKISKKDRRMIKKYIESTRPKLTGYGKRFENDFIAANSFKLPYRKDWYLCESPQEETAETNSTIEKFWWLVKQKKVKMIVMFAQPGWILQDCSKYFPLEENGEETFGDLKVKCLKSGKDKHGLEYRQITGKFGSGKRFTVTHYWLPTWYRQLDKAEQTRMTNLLKTALSQRYPVLIHDPSGAVAPGIFAFAAHMICSIYKTKKMDFQASFLPLRLSRFFAVADPEDYACAAMLVMETFAEASLEISDEDVKKRYKEVKAGWEEWDRYDIQNDKRAYREKTPDDDEDITTMEMADEKSANHTTLIIE